MGWHKPSKYGSRKLVIIGGSLYAIGYLLAGVALHYQSLWILYLGFGFVGGTGLGLAYVTPVATVSTWFTKHQGLATGMVVMGFGFGALVMSKILAPYFMSISHSNLSKSFLYIVLLLLILLPGFAWFLKPSPKKNLQKKNTHTTSAIQHILAKPFFRSEEHTYELQSRGHLVCRLLLKKKKQSSRQTSGRCRTTGQ